MTLGEAAIKFPVGARVRQERTNKMATVISAREHLDRSHRSSEGYDTCGSAFTPPSRYSHGPYIAVKFDAGHEGNQAPEQLTVVDWRLGPTQTITERYEVVVTTTVEVRPL